MKNIIQGFMISLILSISYLYANVKLIKTDGSCLTENSNISSNIKVTDQEKLSDGVCFYHIMYYAGFTDKIISKYDIVVVDRKKPYRLRPIVDISAYNGFRKKIKVENFGAFKSHSVMTFVKSRTKNIIAAINGPLFSFSNGKKHNLLTNPYKDGKETEPDRTFLYGGLNLNQSTAPEPILAMSSNYNHLDLNLFFHNMGSVKKEHNFSKEYHDAYDSTNSYTKKNANLKNVSKDHNHTSNLDWAIGIKSGSFMGQVYIPIDTEEKDIFPKNAKHDEIVYGKGVKDRYWYENAAYYPNIDASEIEPIVAYNEDYVILGLNLGNNDTDGEVINEDVYLAFNSLGMKYGAYLDGGGSSQLVIKGSNGEYVKKGYKKNRAVFSALAIIKAYSDVDDLEEEYKRAIYYLTDFGIMGGDDNGKFNPDNNITRAEVSKMIINILDLMGKPRCGKCEKYKKYKIIKHWFYTSEYAQSIICRGIKEGNGNNELDVNENISYMELSKMITIAFKGPIKKESKSTDWSKPYFTYLQKGYKDRFSETYGILDLGRRSWEQPTEEKTIKEKSHYAKRKEVALFLYRAFILWQDGKFGKYESECEK